MIPANAALAADLAEIAALLRAGRADRFRVRAYEHAARVVRALPVPAADLDEAELRSLAGIGRAMAGLVAEYARTGSSSMLEDLRAAEPPGFGALLGLPLVGVRDARRLAVEHGIADLAALRAAATDPEGPLGLGERLGDRVREALRREPTVTDPRLPLPHARREARALAGVAAALDVVQEVVIAGAVRRCAELVGDFDLVLVAEPGRWPSVRGALHGSRAAVRLLDEAEGVLHLVTPTGHPGRLWLAEPGGRGACLLHATGPEHHLAAVGERGADRGMRLRNDGLWRGAERVAAHDDADVYRVLGLPVIEPELREDDGALAVATVGELPALVGATDLRGDLHVHSDFSGDGKDTVAEMVRDAAGRGYDYVALTDHAENLSINGMSREAVLARRRTIAEVQQEHPGVRILDAAELNIDLRGALDYDPHFLLGFDLGVASVHSHMDRPAAEQTERILAAIAHPTVHVIGHPTGRIIRRRPGYRIDLAAIAEAAAETGTALEVNGSPFRLDLDGPMARAAVRAGALLSLSSDAHSTDELAQIDNAVPVARRGWARAQDVLNARDLAALLELVGRKRRRAG